MHDEQPLLPPPSSWRDREPSPSELAAYLAALRDAELATGARADEGASLP